MTDWGHGKEDTVREVIIEILEIIKEKQMKKADAEKEEEDGMIMKKRTLKERKFDDES